MKKLFLSLAALVMTMSAPVMTSCSSEDLDEVAPVEEVKENVVTLTIKMSEQAETRVGINDETLKLTGWEENDVVKVYHFVQPNLSEGVTFKCTDPSAGTFTGTLPAGKTLDDYNFAVYGRDVEYNRSVSTYIVFPANEVHDNLKDCICLAGPIKDGSCTMSIYNNVIKVTNNGKTVTGAWKRDSQVIKPYGMINDRSGYIPGHIYKNSAFDEAKITIPSGISYIFMPQMQGKISFIDKDGTAIIPEKTISTAVVGKLYKVTIASPYTGTAQRTGGIDVKWVQLWEDGPKFAEYNVGAANNKAESYGGYYTWGSSIDKDPNGAYKSGTDDLSGADDTATNLWGSNWRMPTKDELDALLANCDVEWTTVNGVNGRKFTGKGDYASNSVFLPAAGEYYNGDVPLKQGIIGYYWSSTPSDTGLAYNLSIGSSDQSVGYIPGDYGYSVRAVLAIDAPYTGRAKATIGGNEVNVKWVQLWAGGPKFAEYNVGVTDGKAKSYGGYYYWGSSIDKDPNGAYRAGSGVLSGTDDTATNLWGSNWRMPTKDELDGLLANCDVECGVYGRKYTGKGDYASNSVFLPAAGWYFQNVTGNDAVGCYWSSTPYSSNYASILRFDLEGQEVKDDGRSNCYSVRAVLKE